MYITKVVLDSIRCFKHLQIDFASTDDAHKWVVVLGDNGTGKSTLLRCIAIGVCDQTSAAGLLREIPGDLIRGSGKRGTILIELKAPDGARYRMHTEIERVAKREMVTEAKYEKSTDGGSAWQKVNERDFPWSRLFVCGYGAGRSVEGVSSYQKYTTVNAVYTLFRYDQDLQNPELAAYRLLEAAEKHGNREETRKWLYAMLKHVLMLEAYDDPDLTEAGLKIPGPWGERILGDLADGYQATATWVLDFLFWNMLPPRTAIHDDISGIVLVDEIEQHLHPSWQRQIVGLLSTQFPAVQFIASTHAPLCASGTTDLADEACQLVLLLRDGDLVTGRDRLGPPRRQRADQVLTSYLFGLPTTGDDPTRPQIERYCQLMGKARTSEEDGELGRLRDTMNTYFGSGETKLEQVVMEAIDRVLCQQTATGEFPKEALDWEAKRQLRKLLGFEDRP